MPSPFDWKSLILGKTLFLRTQLSPGECVNVLSSTTGRGWAIGSLHPFIGTIDDQVIVLRKRYNFLVHNSFQTLLTGYLEEKDFGTLIECRMGAHPLIWVFLGGWTILVFVFADASLRTVSEPGGTQIIEIAIGAFVVCFAPMVALLGRWVARFESNELADFLCRELDATASEVRVDEKP